MSSDASPKKQDSLRDLISRVSQPRQASYNVQRLCMSFCAFVLKSLSHIVRVLTYNDSISRLEVSIENFTDTSLPTNRISGVPTP